MRPRHMTRTHGKRYFHMVRKNAPFQLEVGQTLFFGFDNPNSFYHTLLARYSLVDPTEELEKLEEVAKDPKAWRLAREDFLTQVKKITNGVILQSMMVRELVFERVRAEKFPSKPSRYYGIWLLPTIQSAAKWRNDGFTGARLFEVILYGKAHISYPQHLKSDARYSIARLQRLAFQYWESLPPEGRGVRREILAEGSIEVVREIGEKI